MRICINTVLSSQNECQNTLGNSDRSQIHFDIKVNPESKNKKYRRNVNKGKHKDMRKYLAKLDWNNMLMNKTAIECWNILKCEIESITEQFVPLKKQGKRSRKKHLSKEVIRKIAYKLCGWFIDVPERMTTTQITKRHLMQLQLKLDNIKEAIS